MFFCSSFFNPQGISQVQKLLKPVNWDSVAIWKEKINSSPDSIKYHHAYLKAIGWVGELYWYSEKYKSRFDSTEAEMSSQYAKWIEQFPNSSNVYQAIGTAYYESESPKATAYLKKVIQLNPRAAETYLQLAIDAERWGDKQAAQEYMRLASVTDPENPAYSFYYAMYFDEIDLNIFKEKIFALVAKFPAHERGAQGLYWLGYNMKSAEEKIKIYEELRNKYPPEKFSWSSSGMFSLFDQYLFTKRYSDAAALAELLKAKQGWQDNLLFAKGLSHLNDLLGRKEYKAAYDSISKLKAARFSKFANNLALLEAELADKTGNTESGYKKLLSLQAKEPTDELYSAIMELAGRLNKDKKTVNEDLWEIRKKTIKPATSFELGLYTSEKKLKLEDLRGKVVLITFWFPGCGPCRAEFPHFENVVKKFSNKELTYLGINVFPKQDDYVTPFMKGTKYSFIPLRGTSEWAEKAYNVRGEPTNFLIDKEGNIVFANFRTDQDNERTLELMIESLLNK